MAVKFGYLAIIFRRRALEAPKQASLYRAEGLCLHAVLPGLWSTPGENLQLAWRNSRMRAMSSPPFLSHNSGFLAYNDEKIKREPPPSKGYGSLMKGVSTPRGLHERKKKNQSGVGGAFTVVEIGGPSGVRTRAAALKGLCPRPLDDGTTQNW